jgi:hypothetical protein
MGSVNSSLDKCSAAIRRNQYGDSDQGDRLNNIKHCGTSENHVCDTLDAAGKENEGNDGDGFQNAVKFSHCASSIPGM